MKLEKSDEEDFIKHVEKYGCVAIKLIPIGVTGIPDRLVLGPYRFIAFFELKRIQKSVVAPKQIWWYNKLRKFGFDVFITYGKEHAIREFDVLRKQHIENLYETTKTIDS